MLVEVNVAGEAGKSGVAPTELPAFIDRCPVEGRRADDACRRWPTKPEASRRYFAALRELAEQHGLRQLSMGTSQDYLVAVQEGATIVRLGTSLYT